MKSRVWAVCAVLAGLGLGQPAPGAQLTDAVAAELEARIAHGEITVDATAFPIKPALIERFYWERSYEPLWIGDDGPREHARVLRAALAHADHEGLEPSDYAVGLIDKLADSRSPQTLTDLELLLTYELLHYVSDAAYGRLSPPAADPDLFVQRGRVDDELALLRQAAASSDLGDFLNEMLPSNPIYRRLRRALAAYHGIEQAGGWPELPAGPTLREGDRDQRVEVLRRRLEATRDISVGSTDREYFDAGLTQAVQRFQGRHGLAADGLVGPMTRAQLNVPVATRIRQIVVNMERWRWMPDDLGWRYILVNLAGFELDVVESGRLVMNMRTVVGRPYRRTPVFSARMTYIEINPTWTVPPTILREDILPAVRKDAHYLIEQNIRVFDGWGANAPEIDPLRIDWSAIAPAHIPYRLRQDPGPTNALGRIKFMFPNQFQVYLHDTPARQLFQRTVRTFSSGCIRIEHPLRLAEYLLADQAEWTDARIHQVIDSGKTTVVLLRSPIPVHLTYLTVWIGEGGTVHFRNDVYGRDVLLDQALTARNETHLSALPFVMLH